MAVGSGTSEKKPRSTVERIIVQGGIIILLLVLAIELRAYMGLSGTLEALNVLTEDGEKESSMSEVEQVISLFPATRIVAENRIETTVEYSWFSIFKYGQYKLNIVSSRNPQPKASPGNVLNDDSPDQMLRYFTAADDPMAVKALDPKDIIPLPEGGLSFGSSSSDSAPRDGVPPGGESEPDPAADNAAPATDAPVPGAETKSEKTSDSP